MRTIALMALALGLCMAHDMFPYESKELAVEKGVGGIGHWIHDQFMFIFQLISVIIVWPIGLIATVFNHPQVYQNMHNKVVTGPFKLSGYNATTVYV